MKSNSNNSSYNLVNVIVLAFYNGLKVSISYFVEINYVNFC